MCIVGRKVCGEMLHVASFLLLEASMTFGERKRKKKKGFKRVFLKEELKKTSKQIKETHGSGKKSGEREEKKRRKSSCSNIG